MSKTVRLTQGKVAIVDDEDYEELSKYGWYASDIHGWYATRTVTVGGKQKTIFMHRQILESPKGKDIDHINHDGLDNRRENLRICTRSQNKKNGLKYRNNTSGLNGVCWVQKAKKWQAQIKKDGKNIYLGYFNDKDQAGHAVDKKVKELFGEFAVLNFPGKL